jgi:hypothetical protein
MAVFRNWTKKGENKGMELFPYEEEARREYKILFYDLIPSQ